MWRTEHNNNKKENSTKTIRSILKKDFRLLERIVIVDKSFSDLIKNVILWMKIGYCVEYSWHCMENKWKFVRSIKRHITYMS